MNKAIEYPLWFPLTIGYMQIKTPERLQEEMAIFKQKWGGETSFEFNGNKVIINNINFQTFRDELQNKITEDYHNHKNNFD